jgi:hypothetical protein
MTEKYDLLLRFLSEKGSGVWGELKEAFDWIWGLVENPAEKAWIAARDLAALGHLEIAWDLDAIWCVAPPLLTMLPRSGGRAFITGARTEFLDLRLEQVAADKGLWIDRCGGQLGPQTLLLANSSHLDAEDFAVAADINYTYSVADQVSALLPDLQRYLEGFATGRGLPSGFDAERFDPRMQQWQAVTETAERGLYRTRTFDGQVFALLDATSQWRRPIKECGIYEVLRWENLDVLHYSESRSELRVAAQAPLPALHARAASLCSGRLPHFKYRRGEPAQLVYDNIPAAVAMRIARSLNQGLGEDDRA